MVSVQFWTKRFEEVALTKKDASASNTSTPHINCDSCLQKPVDAERQEHHGQPFHYLISEIAGDCKPNHLSPDYAKIHRKLRLPVPVLVIEEACCKLTSGRIHDRYIGSFTMRSASTKYMRDCYSGEVAEGLRDPIIYLKKENMSSGTGFYPGPISVPNTRVS